MKQPTDHLPQLTPAGRRWAARNAGGSIIARVALNQQAHGWPDAYRRTAIETCNDAGAKDGRR